jgi:hypothetical protein
MEGVGVCSREKAGLTIIAATPPKSALRFKFNMSVSVVDRSFQGCALLTTAVSSSIFRRWSTLPVTIASFNAVRYVVTQNFLFDAP